MNALELLENQHNEVKALFEKYEDTSGPKTRQRIVNQIADALAAHATIEEKLFYPSVYIGDTKELLQEAVEEHLAMKRIIADLLELEPSDEAFDAKVTVLREQVEHHVEEEEGELFERVKEARAADELESLGDEMEEMFQALMSGEPRAQVPDETDRAAPLA